MAHCRAQGMHVKVSTRKIPCAAYRQEQVMQPWVPVGSDGLDASSSIQVRDGREQASCSGGHAAQRREGCAAVHVLCMLQSCAESSCRLRAQALFQARRTAVRTTCTAMRSRRSHCNSRQTLRHTRPRPWAQQVSTCSALCSTATASLLAGKAQRSDTKRRSGLVLAAHRRKCMPERHRGRPS